MQAMDRHPQADLSYIPNQLLRKELGQGKFARITGVFT